MVLKLLVSYLQCLGIVRYPIQAIREVLRIIFAALEVLVLVLVSDQVWGVLWVV